LGRRAAWLLLPWDLLLHLLRRLSCSLLLMLLLLLLLLLPHCQSCSRLLLLLQPQASLHPHWQVMMHVLAACCSWAASWVRLRPFASPWHRCSF
jgi:hypothetical protein